MTEVTLSFHFARLDPNTAESIHGAIAAGKIFGLKGKRTIQIFNPKNKTSIFIGGRSGRMVMQYQTDTQLTDAISLCLLGHKEFIPFNMLPPLPEQFLLG